MITIISGTNRNNCLTLEFSKAYAQILTQVQSEEVQILDLKSLPENFLFTALYGKSNPDFDTIFEQYILKASALVIVSPEYNGSYPGILKAFIDGWNPKLLHPIKVALVGIATGRQGNARGMDHLTNVLNYLGLTVVPFKLPISKAKEVWNPEQGLHQEETIKAIQKQISLLI